MEDTDDLTLMGRKLRALREDASISQETLASSIGMNRNNYRKIENGELNITAKTMLKICRSLSIKPGEIFDDIV
ncbi:MAG: helix-turn-helix transcriptional regulator [Halopseudomonas sp.]